MLNTDQFWMDIMENVEMTTAGMVIMVHQSKQLSMDMEKQDWTLEIVCMTMVMVVMSEPF